MLVLAMNSLSLKASEMDGVGACMGGYFSHPLVEPWNKNDIEDAKKACKDVHTFAEGLCLGGYFSNPKVYPWINSEVEDAKKACKGL